MNLPSKVASVCLFFPVFSALASAQLSLDSGQTTANVFESTYFHFRYEAPKGWFALDDTTRLADNKSRYEAQLADALKKNGPNTPARFTEVFPPYDLLIASPTPVTSSHTEQLPRVQVQAMNRGATMKEAGDPAKLISRIPKIKILRRTQPVVLAGHKFVRTDFQFSSGSFLSKFTSVDGDYLVWFDLRADNEKDLLDLVNTMQTLQFSDH